MDVKTYQDARRLGNGTRKGAARVTCGCGQRHWGRHGAAGLLLVRRAAGIPTHVLLQLRAPWTTDGDTWSTLGGALAPGESAQAAALREAAEEAGVRPEQVSVRVEHLLTHPGWSYTTVVADEVSPVVPVFDASESLDVAWVPLDQVEELPLHPLFAQSWPELRALL